MFEKIGGYVVLHLADGTVMAGKIPPNQPLGPEVLHVDTEIFITGGVYTHRDCVTSRFVNQQAIVFVEAATQTQAYAIARRHSRQSWRWLDTGSRPRRRWSLSKSGVGLVLGCVVIAALGLGAMLGQRALDTWRVRPLVEAVRATEAAPAARGPVEAQEAVVASRAPVPELPRPALRVPTLAFRGDSAARDVVAAVALDMRTPVAIPDEVYDAYFNRPGIGAAINRAQEEYGVSGLGLAGLVGHESARGTSPIAREKNNWTGMGAGGDNPAANAYTYASPEECVDHSAGWLAVAYLSEDGQYYGGVSAEGVNQHYAGDRVHWTPGVLRHMQAIVELAARMGPAELRIAAAD